MGIGTYDGEAWDRAKQSAFADDWFGVSTATGVRHDRGPARGQAERGKRTPWPLVPRSHTLERPTLGSVRSLCAICNVNTARLAHESNISRVQTPSEADPQ